MSNLGDWTKNQAACEAAFLAAFGPGPDAWKGKFAWCCHHETEWEPLTEHWSARITFIATEKPLLEQAIRFDNFRPVLSNIAVEAWAEYERVTALALAEYERARALALAEYKRVTAPAWAKYKRVTAPAFAEYGRARALAHLADVPHHSWNGTSIFAGKEVA